VGVGDELPNLTDADTQRLEDLLVRRYDTRAPEATSGRPDKAWRESQVGYHAERIAEEGNARLLWVKHLRDVYTARAEEYARIAQRLESAS
jgi:hypothetical protein